MCVLVSLEAVFLEDSLYKSPPEALFSIGRREREREREMMCTLESDFKIQKRAEKWNFKNPM